LTSVINTENKSALFRMKPHVNVEATSSVLFTEAKRKENIISIIVFVCRVWPRVQQRVMVARCRGLANLAYL